MLGQLMDERELEVKRLEEAHKIAKALAVEKHRTFDENGKKTYQSEAQIENLAAADEEVAEAFKKLQDARHALADKRRAYFDLRMAMDWHKRELSYYQTTMRFHGDKPASRNQPADDDLPFDTEPMAPFDPEPLG